MRAALLSALLFGSATAATAADTLPSIDLRVEPDGVVATYRLPQAAKALRFAREDAQGHRARSWKSRDAGIELVLDGQSEVIRRRDGAPFDTATFEMPPRYVQLEKDYAPFSPYGDGGLLIHSGRFHACPERCDEVDDGATWRMTVVPPAGRHIVQGGRTHDGAVTFDDGGSGTNVYVGKTKPIDTSHVVAVIDETFPARAREQLLALFPKMMDFFAGRLGKLDAKPMLFASNDEKHAGGGFGHQGGTLPGQVFMHLYGPAQGDREGAEFARSMSWFFAHEAAHLFQHYEQAEPEESWMHEGGADAMAALALRELGLVDEAAVQDRLAGAAKYCRGALGDGAMQTLKDRGDFQGYYHCGFVLQMAIDAQLKAATDGRCDLFCAWRRFVGRVEDGAPWSTETYAGIVREATGDEGLPHAMRAMQAGPAAEARAAIDVALAASNTKE